MLSNGSYIEKKINKYLINSMQIFRNNFRYIMRNLKKNGSTSSSSKRLFYENNFNSSKKNKIKEKI